MDGEGSQDYLFDWSLPLHCPALAEQITVPEYFSRDLLKTTECVAQRRLKP